MYIKFRSVIKCSSMIYLDQPQSIGTALIARPVTHGQDDPVSLGYSAPVPQNLQGVLDGSLGVSDTRLVVNRVNIAEHGHAATTGSLG